MKRRDKTKKTGRMRNDSVGTRLIRGLVEIRDALASGEPLSGRLTVRTVRTPDAPSEYGPDDIKRLREERLKVSQAVFAQMLGVSGSLVRAWESTRQRRVPPAIARRLLDQIRRDPLPWLEMVRPKPKAATGAAPRTGRGTIARRAGAA